MRRRLLGASLLLAAFVLLPAADLRAQKKKTLPAVDSDKLGAGEFVGTLKSVPGSDRKFLLETESHQIVPTGRAGTGRVYTGNVNNHVSRVLRVQNQIQQAQVQAARARTPQQQQSAMRRLLSLEGQLNSALVALARSQGAADVAALRRSMPAGYRLKTTKREVEFQASDKVKVRTTAEPEQFDDKGNPRKLTAKERAEAKGKDKNLVGYEWALEKLEVGQRVSVTLASAPSKAADPAKAQAKDKDKDKDEDDKAAEKKMQVKLIVVLAERADNPAPKAKK